MCFRSRKADGMRSVFCLRRRTISARKLATAEQSRFLSAYTQIDLMEH
jgi:hypothetical protein